MRSGPRSTSVTRSGRFRELEALGLVETAVDPADRRRTIVRLRATGAAEAERSYAADPALAAAYRGLMAKVEAEVLEPLWRMERAVRARPLEERLRAAAVTINREHACSPGVPAIRDRGAYAPILLIHGGADDSNGTFPIRSERMYAALKGNGATVRYVVLPNEPHGYRALEPTEETLWQMTDWLDRYVKPRAPASKVAVTG